MDATAKKEILKFIATASGKQLDEKRVELVVLKESLRDPDVRRDVDWAISQIATEQWARIECGSPSVEHIVLETPRDQH